MSTPNRRRAANPAAGHIRPAAPEFGSGPVDHSFPFWSTFLLLFALFALLYFRFWPLIREELDKGEPFFEIPPGMKAGLKVFWGDVKGKIRGWTGRTPMGEL